MYKVLCDGVTICDSRVDELALINPVVKLEENKAGSFTFMLPPAHPKYDVIKKRTSLIQVYQDEELIFSGICIEEKKTFYKQKTITCEGELTFFNDSVQRPRRYQGMTVRGLLEAYVANHNAQVEDSKRFTVGQVTVTDPNDYIYCYTNMETTMKALKEDLVDDLGGFFRIRHEGGVRYLDYLADSPNTNSQIIKIGKNLMDFTVNTDSSEIATAIIPLGCKLEESPVEGLEVRLTIESVNNGVDYVYNQDAVNTYGWIYKTVTWDNVTTAAELKSKGEKYLSDIQFENMVIEAKAIDLNLTDKQIEQFKLSDQIRVVSAPHGLDRYFRLTKMTINLNNPEKNTITLGKDERLSLSAKTNQANQDIKKAVDSIVPPDILMINATKNATALITTAMGGYVYKTNNELYIMDTDNPETATKVWRWNINGLGYSSEGINGTYALAMTMDGHFVANAITVDGLEVGKNVMMGEDATIKWQNVENRPTIPINNNQLENGAGYQTANEVTQITKDTVTAPFINALEITAGSVAAENITGETITGKTLKSCSIQSAKGNIGGWNIDNEYFSADGIYDSRTYTTIIAPPDKYADTDIGAAIFAIRYAIGTGHKYTAWINAEGTIHGKNVEADEIGTMSWGGLPVIVSSTGDYCIRQFGYSDNTLIIYTNTQGNYACSVSTWSDSRLKKDIKDSDVDGLSIIDAIKHRKWNWKDDSFGSPVDLGYVAHELEEIIPDAVNDVEQDIEKMGYESLKQIDNTKIVPYLTKAVQEMHKLIIAQDQRIKVLEERLGIKNG